MYKTKVCLESLMIEEPLDAWTEGETWNGWAVPYFDTITAQHLLAVYQQQNGDDSAWYDATTGEYCFRVELDSEAECYAPTSKEVGGQIRKLYAIGARDWIWDTWEPLN